MVYWGWYPYVIYSILCMYEYVKENQTWACELPVVESIDFQHHYFGPVRFSLRLEKRFHHSFQKEVFILSLDVVIGTGTSNQRVSVGECAKVLTDMQRLCQDVAPLHAKLPQIYMGFDYPRRLEL